MPHPSRLRSVAIPAVATLVALAILLTLGTWQMARLSWKEGVIARIEARAHGEPGTILPEEAWGTFRAEDEDYRRVRVIGTFLHDAETRVHGMMPSGIKGMPVQGYYVLTPLRLASGAVVMVNRGFVPEELRDPAARAEGQIAGETTVTGLVRPPQERGPFTPADDPAKGQWFTRDPAAIAAARGLTRVAPFMIDADATPVPGGWPRGGQTILNVPNNHLSYALTWYGLALTLVGVSGVFLWRRLKSGPEESDGVRADASF